MVCSFDKAYRELTGHNHFPWQKRLYEAFIKGCIPGTCDIPTGLGKTSVIAIWLLALASKSPETKIPRRLVYVVNRRTIVDQSTEVVVALRNKLNEAAENKGSPLFDVTAELRKMVTTGRFDNELLSVSTLRGELADNLQWRFDPLRPAVIIGTVDMIGSKLLFSGYGDTSRTRPLNAGLLGCDTLVVHDEAHLTPAFGQLLRSINKFQTLEKRADFAPPFQILELSATKRKGASSLFQLDFTDRADTIVKSRLYAKKRLFLHEIDKPGPALQEKLADLAFVHNTNKSRVVIFVRSPEDATKIYPLLLKKLTTAAEEEWKRTNNSQNIPKKTNGLIQESCAKSVSVLTGEIRGYERDRLLEEPGMLPFTGKTAAGGTVYLISTSAGEVGMDLHADHMVSDLTTLDSMIQRLGRVNRFGQADARIDVVYEASIKEESRKKTLELLKAENEGDSGLDVSPQALLKLLEKENSYNAFSSVPEMVMATDILLDLWSQTSLMEIPARPEIAPWLHGIQDELPETWMAWRKEVPLLEESGLTDEDVTRWFQACRVSSRETLRKPTYRIKWTGTAEKKWIEHNKDQVVYLLTARGQAKRRTLLELTEQKSSLNFSTIIFPTQIGGLDQKGFFDTQADRTVNDVLDDGLKRVVIERIGEKYHFVPLECWREKAASVGGNEKGDDTAWQVWTTLRNAVQTIESDLQKKVVFRLKVREADEWEDDDDLRECWLILLKERRTSGTQASTSPTVAEHNQAVAGIIKIMAERLNLPVEIKEALILAAIYHDTGKTHDRWQIAAGFDPASESFEPRAKPLTGGVDWRKLDGYRHELGSVMKALETEEICSHAERDLILHLIAAHHGWGRPHFEERAFPPEADEITRQKVNLDIMMRFTALQDRLGYWRLAWLESLTRRADGMASLQHGLDEEASDE
jgi:CRISPR-associated endonuclease/helicase Cas3